MRHRCVRAVLVSGLLGLSAASPNAAAQIGFGGFTVRLEHVATGLASPVQIAHAGDSSGRLFIVEQTGRVHILQGGSILPTPFLDVTAELPVLNAGFDERGLLGIAFHPNYVQNGRVYVRHSRPRVGVAGEPCVGTSRGCHEEMLVEYRVMAGDPDRTDPASRVVLFRVNKPQFNHNGGGIAFGPDGFLYFTLGDGGGANDGLADMPPSHGPIGNAQNLGSVLGKMHRINVAGQGAYTIPAGNPFVGMAGAAPEIFAYGLRNPYLFSFDDLPGGNGALIVADVGQNLFEEIDIVTAGGNYGWVIREGAHCFNPFAPGVPPVTCPTAGLIDPVAEYPHMDGETVNGISIIGGFVYRGSRLPGLTGQYLFGDFSTAFGMPDGRLFVSDLSQPAPAPIFRLRLGGDNAPLARFVKGFGRDPQGEVYIALSTVGSPFGAGGSVVRIVRCPSDFNGSASVSVQDIFDFLGAYFANDPRADFNGGGVSVQDIFDYLGAYFGGC